MRTSMERLLNVKEAAGLLGTSTSYVRRYFKNIPGVELLPSRNPARTSHTRIHVQLRIPESVLEAERAKWRVRDQPKKLKPKPPTFPYRGLIN